MENFMQIVLSIITATVTSFVGFLFYKIKKIAEQRAKDEEIRLQSVLLYEESIKRAVCALCRDRILQGYRYYKQNGGVSTQDLETMTKLYKAYHALGGNGTITAVFEKILKLPISEGV